MLDEERIELIEIPPGIFLMGSEEGGEDDERPAHWVDVPRFWMAKHPVTQAQWKFVASLPRVEIELEPDPSHFKGGNHPVEQVSWYEAVEFCARLSVCEDKTYRLPTEAEWEYACRAGTSTMFHFGDELSPKMANFDFAKTSEVGSFPPNAFGLYDMHGNVLEWCQDIWHGNYEGAPTDGSAWVDGDGDSGLRLLRGGSWCADPRFCRSAFRDINFPVNLTRIIGFRVCCSPPGTL